MTTFLCVPKISPNLLPDVLNPIPWYLNISIDTFCTNIGTSDSTYHINEPPSKTCSVLHTAKNVPISDHILCYFIEYAICKLTAHHFYLHQVHVSVICHFSLCIGWCIYASICYCNNASMLIQVYSLSTHSWSRCDVSVFGCEA